MDSLLLIYFLSLESISIEMPISAIKLAHKMCDQLFKKHIECKICRWGKSSAKWKNILPSERAYLQNNIINMLTRVILSKPLWKVVVTYFPNVKKYLPKVGLVTLTISDFPYLDCLIIWWEPRHLGRFKQIYKQLEQSF